MAEPIQALAAANTLTAEERRAEEKISEADAALAPAKPLGEGEPGAAAGMRYLASYAYVFRHPRWAMNLFWGGLCHLSTAVIPIVGALVYLGYLQEVIDSLQASGEAEEHPEFDIQHFKRYLQRGVWPMLVGLVVGVFIVPASVVLLYLFTIGTVFLTLAVGEDYGFLVLGVAVLLACGGVLVFSLLLSLLLTPLHIRLGLTQDFKRGLNFRWHLDFVRRVWPELLLSSCFAFVTGFLVCLAGALFFCVGMYPATALWQMASAHLASQLYTLYLRRGGEPVPLPAAPTPAVLALSPALPAG